MHIMRIFWSLILYRATSQVISPKTACDFRKGSAGHAAASCIFQGIQGPMMALLTVHPKTCGSRPFPMISTDLAIGHIWEHCKNLFPGRLSSKAGCASTMFVLLSSETDLFGVLCGECWDQVWIERHAVRRESFFPTDTHKLNFCSLKWVLMVYGSCILLQLGDKCDKPHQKVSTVSRKHLWNFRLADHCTAWWRIIISKDWPTAKDALGGSWGGLSQYPSPTRSRFISELSIVTFQGCFYEMCPFFSLNQSLFARCIVAPGCTQQEAYSGLIIFWCQRWGDLFAVPTRHMFSILKFAHVTYVAHELRGNIMLKCWKDEFSLRRWAMFQVLWSVLPESVGILTIVWWGCSRYPFPCFSQGCSLCICCTDEIFGNASKQEGTRSLSKLILAIWHRFCQNTLQAILCYR